MTFAQDLRSQTAAVRIRHRKLGVRKALTAAQRKQAAQVFSADADSFSGSKRLLNTHHDAYKKVVSVRRAATDYWKVQTVSYPEPGIRLIRKEKIEAFNAKMIGFEQELRQHVTALELVYFDLREAARTNLGDLYNPQDYPSTLAGEFDLAWEYPAIEPPAYLKELNPALYEQEQQRIAARFEEAVRLTEQALATELSELVGHLCDRLTGQDDGKPKSVRQSAITNIKDFFARFSEMGIRSNEQLETLAKQANELVNGVEPAELKKNASMRDNLAAKMAEVRAAVDSMVVVRKREISLDDDGESEGDEVPVGGELFA